MSPTILPTSLPQELPPGSQADTVLISNPSNLTADISPTQPALLNIPDEPVPNSMVIRFEPELSQAERLAYITSLGGQVVQEIKPLNTVIISLPANRTATIQSQSVPAGVVENEPDFYAGALYSPNDSLAAGQWGLDVVKAPQAWDLLPVSTPRVTVAVIDSGICASHADLQGRIVSNGWDFIDNDSTPQDEYGHGCAVAGIIAANSNNGLGIAGVAPNANVLPLRVLDAAGIGRYSNVAAAIVYAVDNGAEAINLSLGGPNPSSVLQDAVNYAEANGVTVIAAAGNSGLEQVFYPAAYPAVVAIG
jgi:thermitase